MRQLSLLDSPVLLPDFEQMRYIASHVKVWMPSRAKAETLNDHFARLMKAIREEIISYEQTLAQNKFEPNIDPDVFLFYIKWERA
jgi:hypothetical protein